MKNTIDIAINKADKNDLAAILALQKTAYRSEAEINNDFSIPPLHQTIDEIASEFNNQIFLKVEDNGEIIGSVRCYFKNSTCYIGKLIVHPDYQNHGIGTKLLVEAENQFPDADRYELFTGLKSVKNLHIYNKHGYREYERKQVSDQLILVYLEKNK